MAIIKVKQEINVYEVNDGETPGLDFPTIGVDSYWNRNEFIVLRIGKNTYTVIGDDLKTAIDNAMNSGTV